MIELLIQLMRFYEVGKSVGRPRRRGEPLRLTPWQQHKRRMRIQRRRELRAKEKP